MLYVLGRFFMNYQNELKRINEKYYEEIKKSYGKYIKNFDRIPDITKKVFVIPDEKCVGKHSDLIMMRGKCVTRNGYIYIRESAFSEHLIIHEFIHRLSRNFRYKGLLRWGWIEGIGFEQNKIDYNGLNEILTEWLAYKITQIKEPGVYQENFIFVESLLKKCCSSEVLEEAFFNGDYNTILEENIKLYLHKTPEILNVLSNVIKGPIS